MNPCILDAPSITLHPVGKTRKKGERVSLECEAEGNPRPTIIWIKEQHEKVDKDKIKLSKKIYSGWVWSAAALCSLRGKYWELPL